MLAPGGGTQCLPHPTNADPAHPRLNREHKETCEMDWSDKVEAYNIDQTCAHYHNRSTEVQFHPHSAKLEERWATSVPAPPRDPPANTCLQHLHLCSCALCWGPSPRPPAS